MYKKFVSITLSILLLACGVGLVDYIKRTKTGWDDLKQTTRDLAEKYSTNSII